MRSFPTDDAVRAAARRICANLAARSLGRAVAAYFSEPDFAGMTCSDLGRNPPGGIIADDLLALALQDITCRPRLARQSPPAAPLGPCRSRGAEQHPVGLRHLPTGVR